MKFGAVFGGPDKSKSLLQMQKITVFLMFPDFGEEKQKV